MKGIWIGAAAILGVIAAPAGVAQTKPSAPHDFAGRYDRDTGNITITRTGPGRYTLAVALMYEMVTGNFATGEWEQTGSAQGNVLSIAPQDGDTGHKLCRMTYALVAKRAQYRITGCGRVMDGTYRRTAL